MPNSLFSACASQRADGLPVPWAANAEAQQALRAAIEQSPAPTLLLDYDGTLAPFQDDKMQACVYPGVVERLERIAAGPTRIAFISGRPVAELHQLLPMATSCEMWGMHGRERYTPGRGVVRFEPSVPQKAALDAAQSALERMSYGHALERKAGSVALHWRRIDVLPAGRERAQQDAREVFAPHDGTHALSLLPFDGGLELRTADRTKAHAAQALLEGFDPGAAAFLGDDVTDEDAFDVLEQSGGLALLVVSKPRPSRACFWLRPPEELLAFLDLWASAAAGRSTHWR